MALNQTGRLIRMTTGPLGPDEVVVTSFSGREAISRLFSFNLDFISTNLDLKPGAIIGKDLTIELDRRDNRGTPLTPRHFHGYVNRFAAGQVVHKDEGVHKYRKYRAEMVPWLWFLTQTARCFLFFPEKEDKTIFEVIEAVFARAKSDLHVDPVNDLKGISDLKKRKVKHCVQYRETDFNFVSRTMERYGVFYYFKFEEGKHTLVLDMKKNYPQCEEKEVIYPRVTGGQSAEDHITDWEHDYEFVSGKWAHTDYNFEKPSTSLKVDAPKLPSIDLGQNDKYEIYDYPGEYMVKGDGETDAKVRQEEEEVPYSLVQGASNCRTFTPGHKFKLMIHPDEEAVSEHGKSYLLTAVEHSASQPTDDTGDAAAEHYSNRFTCIPDSVQFRPERITPNPVISGVQTAVVVGPGGEEIHTDNYGRVKVQFHWDREGKKDGNSSCWVRVSQFWAGKDWGSMHIPHVGQEVIVDFLEGDPDKPIITGRVYNEEQMPFLGLPDTKTKSVFRDYGDNHFTMEGAPGKQQIQLYSPHSETKFTMGAPNQGEGFSLWTTANYLKHIAIDAINFVGGSETTTTQGNRTWVVGGNWQEHIAGVVNTKWDGVGFRIHGGLYSDTFIGGKHTAYIAGVLDTYVAKKFEFSKGSSFKRFSSKEDHVNYATYKKRTTGAVTVDSDACYTILGGASDASQVILDSGKALIKSGSSAIEIKKSGTITITANSDLTLYSRGTLNLFAEGGMEIAKGGEVHIKMAKITHKHIKVS